MLWSDLMWCFVLVDVKHSTLCRSPVLLFINAYLIRAEPEAFESRLVGRAWPVRCGKAANDLFGDVANSIRMVLKYNTIPKTKSCPDLVYRYEMLDNRSYRILHTDVLKVFEILLIGNPFS